MSVSMSKMHQPGQHGGLTRLTVPRVRRALTHPDFQATSGAASKMHKCRTRTFFSANELILACDHARFGRSIPINVLRGTTFWEIWKHCKEKYTSMFHTTATTTTTRLLQPSNLGIINHAQSHQPDRSPQQTYFFSASACFCSSLSTPLCSVFP